MVELWTVFSPKLRKKAQGAWLLESSQGEKCLIYTSKGLIYHAESDFYQGFEAINRVNQWEGIDSIQWEKLQSTEQFSMHVHASAARRIFLSLQNYQFDSQTQIHHVIKVLPTGETFTIRSPVSIIGRDPFCDISLSIPTISKIHVLLVFTNEHCYLHDLGSRNGTYVAAERVVFQVIQEATHFFIGEIPCLIEKHQEFQEMIGNDPHMRIDRFEEPDEVTKPIPIKKTRNINIDPKLLSQQLFVRTLSSNTN